MERIKESEVLDYLKRKAEFKASSSIAERVGNFYRVYSYSTLMAEYDLVKKEWIYFNDRKYSVTTSRLQNKLREVM